MMRVRPLFAVAIAAMVFLPSPVSAGGFAGRGGVVVVVAPRGAVVVTRPAPRVVVKAPGVIPVVITPRRFVSPFGTAVIVPRPFPLFVVSAPPAIVYAPPPVIAVPPPPAVAPSPLPIPTVIEYPTGWYQLRGDGVTTPYVWVWIPKPPSPPAEAPPAAPPAPPSGPSQAPPVPSSMPSSTSPGTVYRWIDEQDVVHWTDSREAIPERYRAQAQRF